MFKQIRRQNRTYNYTQAYSFPLYVLHFVLPICWGGEGHAVAQLVEALCYKPEGRGFFSSCCIGIFHWHNPSHLHCGPGIDSASDRNEYQEYFLGSKGGRCVGRTTLPPSCADCLEIWGAATSWNPQGLSKPVIGLLYIFCFLLPKCGPNFSELTRTTYKFE